MVELVVVVVTERDFSRRVVCQVFEPGCASMFASCSIEEGPTKR